MSDCLLLCDDVIESHRTGKQSLHGIIGGITVPELPAVIGGFVAYIRFRNVYPSQEIRFVFRRASDDQEVVSFDMQSPDQSDPLNQHTLIIRIPRFTVDDTGGYIFSAEHNGTPIVATRIVVHQVVPRGEE